MMPMSRDALAQVCCGRLLDYVVERNQAFTADKRALAELAAAGDLFSKGVEHGGLSLRCDDASCYATRQWPILSIWPWCARSTISSDLAISASTDSESAWSRGDSNR